MRVAVFTNQFPARPVTFFARDLRALIDAGLEVDVFPFYPLDTRLWEHVSTVLSEQDLPRDRVHHLPLRACVRSLNRAGLKRVPRFLRDWIGVEWSALPFGVGATLKTAYIALKAWAWAQERHARYDHLLAYWGSYAACCAYLYHRLTDSRVPLSMFVQARADLYRGPVHLVRNMLYADNIFLTCEFNRDYIRHRYPAVFRRVTGKIHMHYTGVELREIAFAPAPRPAANLLAVGRFEKLKGLHCLLQALSRLERRIPMVELELIGGGDEDQALRMLARRLGIASRVTFRGWLRPDEVLAAMRQATILVHPSVELDAMPNVVKESLAVGTPVVASRMAGIPEMLQQGRCGVLVTPGDVDELARAIESLLDDPTRRQVYAQAGREHVARSYDLRQNGERLAARLRSTPQREQGPRVER